MISLLRGSASFLVGALLAISGSSVATAAASARPVNQPEVGGSLVSVFDQPAWCLHGSGSVTLQACDTGNAGQLWAFSSGRMVSDAGPCLELPGNNSANGTELQTASCNTGNAQKFSRDNTTNEIKHDGSGKCVDVKDGSFAAGTAIIIWTCHGGQNQKWSLGQSDLQVSTAHTQTTPLKIAKGASADGTFTVANAMDRQTAPRVDLGITEPSAGVTMSGTAGGSYSCSSTTACTGTSVSGGQSDNITRTFTAAADAATGVYEVSLTATVTDINDVPGNNSATLFIEVTDATPPPPPPPTEPRCHLIYVNLLGLIRICI